MFEVFSCTASTQSEDRKNLGGEEVPSDPQWYSICQRSVKNSSVDSKDFLQYPEGSASLDV